MYLLGELDTRVAEDCAVGHLANFLIKNRLS